MKWFKRRFNNWVREVVYSAAEDEDMSDQPCGQPIECVKASNDIMDHRKSYTVKMQPANGGTIIEVSHYNERIGEYNRDLYIVNEGVDLGNEISKVLVQYRLTHS